MVKRNLKVTVCAFMVGILMSISAVIAYAATAESPWGYYGPYLNYSYQNKASIVTGSSSVSAYTDVQNQAFANVPTGYMGAKAMMYNSSNSLVAQSDYRYNTQPLYSMSQSTSITTHGTYYSKGLTQAYDGNGYVTYTTFASPSLNY
ncbi:MAG: hypothetical protein ACYC21_08080 [Eubacteriales bacterium]